MKVAILAGGLGTRLQEETTVRPKPMVEIGDRPILWHIMRIYSAYGFNEFVVALGYKGEAIKDYFLNYRAKSGDVSVDLRTGDVTVHGGEGAVDAWLVHLVGTGQNTETGGRIKRLKRWIDDDTFMMTYGDGVANVDLKALLDFHRGHGRLATVTAVRPPARFGALTIDGQRGVAFSEKPQAGEGWINGGFFVLSRRVFDYIDGDATIFEREPMERLAADEQLMVFRHEGFWQCMDTLRDLRLLNALWERGEAPWRT
jgi:glucose-1-phosphate cytidylyltransferase